MKVKVDKDGKVIIPESVVKTQVINYLISKGYRCPEDFGIVNTTGVYNEKKKCWMSNSRRWVGVPDILGFRKKEHTILYDIQVFAIECKSATGKLRPKQARWRDKFLSTGGLYILARDVDDVIKAGL